MDLTVGDIISTQTINAGEFQGITKEVLAGLDMDFKGMPFGPMPELLSIAEYVTKVHAICMSCGNLAQFSHRKIKSDEQVLIGAVEEYKPLCRLCYNKNRS